MKVEAHHAGDDEIGYWHRTENRICAWLPSVRYFYRSEWRSHGLPCSLKCPKHSREYIWQQPSMKHNSNGLSGCLCIINYIWQGGCSCQYYTVIVEVMLTESRACEKNEFPKALLWTMGISPNVAATGRIWHETPRMKCAQIYNMKRRKDLQ